MEAKSLSPNTLAQKVELIALTRALELAEGKILNVYMDSKYAFWVLHAHGAIWKERGLLTTRGSPIKHSLEILQLLEVVQKPKAVAVMHCKAHQRCNQNIAKGNRRADLMEKAAAQRTLNNFQGALIPQATVPLESPSYTSKEVQLAEKFKCKKVRRWMVENFQWTNPNKISDWTDDEKICTKEHTLVQMPW